MQPGVVEPDTTDTAGRSLILDRCPQCTYSLAGLPETGTCPECGTAYDPDHILLWGWVRGSGASIATGTWRDSGWILFLGGAGFLPLLMDGLIRGRWSLAALFVVPWIICMVVAISLRRRMPQPAPIELQLSPAGVRLVLAPSSLNRPAYEPWNRMRGVKIERVREDRVRMRFRRRIPWWMPEIQPIDVEVRLTNEQLSVVRDQIRNWLARPR